MTLVEVLVDTVGSISITLVALKVRHALRPKTVFAVAAEDNSGTIPWSYRQSARGVWGFYCYKCVNVHKNTSQPQYCECEEYHSGHFHFKCGDCGYQVIMRPADSK